MNQGSAFALFRAEAIKLRRSLILGLALLFPLGLLVISISVGALVITPGEGATWRSWMTFSLVPWAYFFLPMLVCLLATQLLNLEHQNHQWKHLNALPVARWKHLATKQCILGILLFLSHLLLVAGYCAGGWVLRMARPALHWELPNLFQAATVLGILWAASWAMMGVHTWLAFRFSNLGVNLGLGITGVALIAVASRKPETARFLPWAMPSMGLTDWMGLEKPVTPWVVVGISLGMGTLLMALACRDAHKRESAGS